MLCRRRPSEKMVLKQQTSTTLNLQFRCRISLSSFELQNRIRRVLQTAFTNNIKKSHTNILSPNDVVISLRIFLLLSLVGVVGCFSWRRFHTTWAKSFLWWRWCKHITYGERAHMCVLKWCCWTRFGNAEDEDRLSQNCDDGKRKIELNEKIKLINYLWSQRDLPLNFLFLQVA